MRSTLVLAAIIIVQGCASSSEVYLADGGKTHKISCGGPTMNYGHCLEKAGKVCKEKGYTLLNRAGDGVPVSRVTNATGDYAKKSGIMPTRKLFVRCN